MAVRYLFNIAIIYSLMTTIGWSEGNLEVDELLNLDLQDLMGLEVISAGKKTQSLREVPAAVFVVTQEDIQRAGATNLPDVLRLVPGMFVGQINSHAWGVSARGFNEYYANKMLVMIDGRSVYVREFSGVWWDQINLVLEDIDRIEVIRGPGGTLWGANAVNGIINIITKSAKDTQGGLVKMALGDQLEYLTALRYGAQWGENGHMRVYAKSHRQQTVDADLPDPARNTQVGFRFDTALSEDDDLTVQGDTYRGRSREINYSIYPVESEDETYHGTNILARWTRHVDEQRELQIQSYFDSYRRNTNATDSRTQTFDLDMQYRFPLLERHEILWGMNGRYYEQRAINTLNSEFLPPDYSEELYSFFIQDEIILVPERWRLTLGVKLEYTELTRWESQPSIRLLWTPNEQRALWAAISKAVRIPDWARTRGQIKIYHADERSPLPFPVYYHISPPENDELKSEYLTAYELGWRETFSEQVLFDATIFMHEYDKLAYFTALPTPEIRPDGAAFAGSYLNQESWNSYGAELALNWQASDTLQFQAAYSYLNNMVGRTSAKTAPKHQIVLGTHWQFVPDWQTNVWLRRNSSVPNNPNIIGLDEIDAYTELDVRLAWQYKKNIEFSVVGRNLLNEYHKEARWASTNQQYLSVKRNFYAQVRWEF